jgi:hypothetical protein
VGRTPSNDRRNTPELVNDSIEFMLVDRQGALWLEQCVAWRAWRAVS